MFGTVAKATERIGVGPLDHTIIEAREGSIQMLEAEDLILVVIADKRANLGYIRLEMRRAARRVREAIPL